MTKYSFDIDKLKNEYEIKNKLKKILKKADNTIFTINEKIANSYMLNNYHKEKHKSEKNIKKTKLYVFWKTMYFNNVNFRAFVTLYSYFKHKIIYNILNLIFIDPIDKIIMEYYGYETMEIIEYFSKYLDYDNYINIKPIMNV